MNFKHYFEAKTEESAPQQEHFAPETTSDYQKTKQTLDQYWGGEYPAGGIFTSELIARLGLNFSDLMKKRIIQQSQHGNYELNKDLTSTNGVLGKAPPPPAKPIKKISWQDYVKMKAKNNPR